MRPVDFIARKRDGGEHGADELRWFVRSVVSGEIADYQTSAWLMAATLRGLTDRETADLTLAMRDSGRTLDLSGLPGTPVDKHSSGGVGDKATLAVVPILVAAGVPVLKMSGRGLGFSGGTIDKLEAIAGMRTELSVDEAVAQVKAVGAAIVGQTQELAPADKALYALRDVTATVESIPLIAASIMSKKLAAGGRAIVLDVKVGRGAFMKTRERARELARLMVDIGRRAGVPTVATLTAMDEPLGRCVGNALEVREACEYLVRPALAEPRFRLLCETLAAESLVAARACADEPAALELVRTLVETGAAAAKLEQIIQAQGGEAAVVRDPARLPRAGSVVAVAAERAAYVADIDAEAVGKLSVEMGAGRRVKTDVIDPAVGIVLHAKCGDRVAAGQMVAEVHVNAGDARAYAAALLAAYRFAAQAPTVTEIVLERVG